MFAGTSTPYLQGKSPIQYLPQCWLINFHLHLKQNKVQIEFFQMWTPTIQQMHDRVIMDYVHSNIPSKKGHLHIPLGQWIQSPDQRFRYVKSIQTKLIYKENRQGWIIYVTPSNSRWFCRLQLLVSSVPTDSNPVKVIIEISQRLVVISPSEAPPQYIHLILTLSSFYYQRHKITCERYLCLQSTTACKTLWIMNNIRSVVSLRSGRGIKKAHWK